MCSPLACMCCSLFAVGLVTLILLAFFSWDSLEFNEYGLDYSWVTKRIHPQTFTAGFYFLGIGHSFIEFPATVQTIEFSADRVANGPPLKGRTSDGLEVILEISFQYKLVPTNLHTLYMKYGANYKRVYEKMAIDVLSDIATDYTAYDFFMERTKIGLAMQEALNELYKANCHASIDFFQLRSVDLPDGFEDAIQLSEVKKQDIKKSQAEKNRTQIELETLLLKAEYQKNITTNIANGEADSLLKQNEANVNAFLMSQNYQATSYSHLKKQLKMSNEELLEFIKAKLVKEFNADNMVVAIDPVKGIKKLELQG